MIKHNYVYFNVQVSTVATYKVYHQLILNSNNESRKFTLSSAITSLMHLHDTIEKENNTNMYMYFQTEYGMYVCMYIGSYASYAQTLGI